MRGWEKVLTGRSARSQQWIRSCHAASICSAYPAGIVSPKTQADIFVHGGHAVDGAFNRCC